MPPETQDAVVGVLLAGGQSRRMGGGDKCLLDLGGRPILAHVIDRLRPQVQTIVLNAGGDPSRFDAFDLPVIADALEGFLGPLAGVYTGMTWAMEHHPSCSHIVTVPTDAPFLPCDLVGRIWSAMQNENAVLGCAASGGRSHPVVGLWPVTLKKALGEAIQIEGMRKIDKWTARFSLATVSFDDQPVDPFFNVNAPEDLLRAQSMVV